MHEVYYFLNFQLRSYGTSGDIFGPPYVGSEHLTSGAPSLPLVTHNNSGARVANTRSNKSPMQKRIQF
jgi:hypothetical protein